jgi:thiol-disulfide isomerase/thioredoxin
MSRLLRAVVAVLLALPWTGTDDKLAAQVNGTPRRAERLKAIQADYQAALDELNKAIRAGKVKAADDGGYREVADLRKRTAERVRVLIDADPKDGAALDAILFSMCSLGADENDRKLYQLVLDHHLVSAKLGAVVGRPYVDEPFLRTIAAKSPHADVRGQASLALAQHLARADRLPEAEHLLERIIELDKELAADKTPSGNLPKAAESLLFEIRHLSVGKAVPEIDGWDTDDKPMKLSEYRGKVVLLMFWATWCGPCMAMVPHERDLVQRYAGRPFAIVGVNGDADITYGPKGEQVDNRALVKDVMKRERITWRSFKDYLPEGKEQISQRWNVRGWPRIYLIDHEGLIRQKFLSSPGKVALDAAVEKLVAAAEAGRNKPGP